MLCKAICPALAHKCCNFISSSKQPICQAACWGPCGARELGWNGVSRDTCNVWGGGGEGGWGEKEDSGKAEQIRCAHAGWSTAGRCETSHSIAVRVGRLHLVVRFQPDTTPPFACPSCLEVLACDPDPNVRPQDYFGITTDDTVAEIGIHAMPPLCSSAARLKECQMHHPSHCLNLPSAEQPPCLQHG